MRYQQIKRCRLGNGTHLIPVLNLGLQALTGVFLRDESSLVTVAPLELVLSPESGLLQLNHTYDPSEMYGDHYGYRSGLNQSMVNHLQRKVRYLERLVQLSSDDVVLDIGSNDCTALKSYSVAGLRRIGIDPTGRKFAAYYPNDVRLIPDFFKAELYRSAMLLPAKIITSIAMFYDLENPIAFAREVETILAQDGVWHFEQSYMPSMLRMNSYDTICHEHLEYYSLSVIKKILDAADLKLVDVTMNHINGGSFAVTATKQSNRILKANQSVIDWMLHQEEQMELNTPRPYHDFAMRVFCHRDRLVKLIRTLVADGKRVLGYGASTKGNVVLQFCGLGAAEIPAIAEVNQDKWGCITPGTHIPIISEAQARAMNPDYFLVLPWHFRDNILHREKEYLSSGGKFIFPFPEIEIF
jgi:C-methyltransferase C-terminal domain/Putative zinc binding domain/Methyltransferase domain